MDESNTVPSGTNIASIKTAATSGYVLTSNGSDAEFKALTVPGPSFATVTSTGPYNAVSINAEAGIITTTALTNDGSGTGLTALFEVNNSYVTTSSVVLLTCQGTTYTTGVVYASISQVSNGSFAILISTIKGSITAQVLKIHFHVINS